MSPCFIPVSFFPGLKSPVPKTFLHSALTTVLLFSLMPISDRCCKNTDELEIRPVKKKEPESILYSPPPKPRTRPDNACIMTKLNAPAPKTAAPSPLFLESELESSLSTLAISVEKGDFNLKFSPAFSADLSSLTFEIQEVDTPPSPLFKIKPRYPLIAKHQKTEGALLMQFTVNPKGETQDIRIMEADPPGIFNDSALEAVRQWRFNPGYKNGRPVSVRVSLPIKYHLEE